MMAARANNALYVGDDETDEDVFGLPDARVFTIRVGEKRSSRAHFFLKRQSEISRLLKILVQFHRRNTAP
jgi:trehalose 6-phosphate phosphatase